ncbi:adenylosuccinate lyase [Dictyostelium discoideum AX4]|uniref:Adenylosuccinate lyase n=1 Tax=Dictyostelium discoideum TaxID=44689 RepID=PUR8_DICDI|nr:adenylosuccinate lyase [Dictyostelium discoideum AX4]Q54J34.1 RecName: Full=Adenylosuccinate lyase; Short=ASL; AltName: Full=Adenylosuccinase; Short=ASase [Dictyostelium discoideum]EAL63263.1 adenylosuccinate lyase [Dictyostelium discoideum AX4]|eukprot:XP_636767.1 adenylosuccinate lyase [Dictyostelium discoideum AX4]
MSTTTNIQLNNLTAISPIDGRYWGQVQVLSEYFSEYALIKYRVQVEIEYFIELSKLSELKPLNAVNKEDDHKKLRDIYLQFKESDAQKIKQIEKTTNHDIKAVEYFIKEKMHTELQYSEVVTEFIHFGLTSQDINNTAIPLSIVESVEKVLIPQLKQSILEPLRQFAQQWKSIPMLARTHGQPATPTTVGKELMVFIERLENQINHLEQSVPHTCKFGGATGNLNAHKVSYPAIDWVVFSEKFVKVLHPSLKRMRFTTQIEHYDNVASLLDAFKRINTILIDLCRDIWTYISMEYFNQKLVKGEVGSSTMPHKVNPIDFENAEGNMGVANALYEHLSAKLPISRLQRDLTDSTVLRSIGVPFSHSILSFKSIQRGLSKLVLNEANIAKDLDANWAVVSEAIQTILRREGFPKPYEALKELTRVSGSKKITESDIQTFIDSLSIPDDIKSELKLITPFNYIGIIPDF